jgi:fatty acid desaturase
MTDIREVQSWIERPLSLVSSWELVPQVNMTKAELLNAMTRLILIITLVLFLIGISGWWLFLILSLALIFLIWYTTIRTIETKGMRVEWYRVPKPRKRRHKRERSIEEPEFYLKSR